MWTMTRRTIVQDEFGGIATRPAMVYENGVLVASFFSERWGDHLARLVVAWMTLLSLSWAEARPTFKAMWIEGAELCRSSALSVQEPDSTESGAK